MSASGAAPMRRWSPARAGCLIALVVALEAFASQATPGLAVDWVDPDTTLTLTLDADQQQHWRRWRVFIGTSDVTALLRLAAPGRVDVVPGLTRWAAGEGEVVVYDGDWRELARWPLRVRSGGGFERSEMVPNLALHIEGRGAESRSDGQPASARGDYADVDLTAGASWKGTRNGWTLEAAAGLSGNSHRGKTLRAAELGATAPKVDLAEYRLALEREGRRLEFGHLSAGSHPLLAQGLNRRGIGFVSPLANGADVALHWLGGSTVVGWDHLSGLETTEHQTRLLGVGLELIPDRPSGLRAEFSVLDAELQSRSDFNRGQVPDAERSRGLGLRLLGRSSGGRVQGEVAWARSTFANPFDPALAQGEVPQAVVPATRNALSASMQLRLLRQWSLATRPLDLTLGLRHERAAPLYRSLAAFVTPDQALSQLNLQVSWIGASAQLQRATRADNLDRIATLLRTRSDDWSLDLNLPLTAWWDGEAGQPSRWPTVGWGSRSVWQRAVNVPRTEDSGFAESQRPDQVDASQRLNLAWTLSDGALNVGFMRARVDNRQPGREQSDFERQTLQVGLEGTLSESLRWAMSANRNRQRSVESGLVSWNTGGVVQADWRIDDQWSIGGQVSHDLANDSRGLASQSNQGFHLQLTRRLSLAGLGQVPIGGQIFVRLGQQTQRQRDSVFDLAADWRSHWVDLGLSLNVF